MRYKIFLLLFFYFTGISGSFSLGVKQAENIPYSQEEDGRSNLLDIYYKKSNSLNNVLVFIHGGSWNSGKKEMYWWLGRNFARKDVVSVIINYSLSPYQYGEMAKDCAAALKWVKKNISDYGGDPDRIFVMGHSSGGHLAELINLDPRFFKEQDIINPIRGVILNDAFGLDMHEYMSTAEKDSYYSSFIKTFSTDEQIWKKASPFSYIGNAGNAHLIFMGGRTYPSILEQSNRLYEFLKAAGMQPQIYTIKRKKHIPMISQMIFGCNRVYGIMVDFMKNH